MSNNVVQTDKRTIHSNLSIFIFIFVLIFISSLNPSKCPSSTFMYCIRPSHPKDKK